MIMNLNFYREKIHKTSNIIIKLLILFLTYGFLYYELFYKKDIYSFIPVFINAFNYSSNIFLFIIATLMIIANWGIETIKWKKLIDKIEYVQLTKAIKAVLIGITIGSFTPNRIGEFFGRAFILKKENILKGILITVIGSFSQLLITLTIGSLAFFIFTNNVDVSRYIDKTVILTINISGIFLSITGLLFYFNVYKFTNLFQKIHLQKIKNLINVLTLYSRKELFLILCLSFIRYLVFSIQFYLILFFFGINIFFPYALLIIFVIYYLITIIPTIALSEISVRGTVSIIIFNLFLGINYIDNFEIIIITASTIVWLINIIIPAIIGSVLAVKMKFLQ